MRACHRVLIAETAATRSNGASPRRMTSQQHSTQIVKNKAIMVIYKKKIIFLFESTVIVEPATFE
jgi:hypothetical protein